MAYSNIKYVLSLIPERIICDLLFIRSVESIYTLKRQSSNGILFYSQRYVRVGIIRSIFSAAQRNKINRNLRTKQDQLLDRQ